MDTTLHHALLVLILILQHQHLANCAQADEPDVNAVMLCQAQLLKKARVQSSKWR
jgi:hypothetical protein